MINDIIYNTPVTMQFFAAGDLSCKTLEAFATVKVHNVGWGNLWFRTFVEECDLHLVPYLHEQGNIWSHV